MSVGPDRVSRSRWQSTWDVASDLLIATALIWTLPLLLGALHAVVNLVRQAE